MAKSTSDWVQYISWWSVGQDLIKASECDEVGLGHSKTRTGQRITEKQAEEIVRLFRSNPQYSRNGFSHFEEIQLYVDGISKDRISDFTCNFLKSFLIDFTIDQCEKLQIPTASTQIDYTTTKQTNLLIITR